MRKQRKQHNQLWVASILFAILLTACGTTAQSAALPPATIATAATTAPLPAATATSASQPAATAASTSAPEAKNVKFVIVPDATTASYSIDEVFINQNNKLATAVGKTSNIEGELVLNYSDPSASEFGQFTVDISALKSDQGRRDSAIQRQWLESSKFPLATFVVKQVIDFPSNPQAGQAIQFKLLGDMKVRETTREVTWDVTATLNGEQLTGQATTFVMLADYNIPVPNIAGILKVTDGAKLTLDFTMQAIR